MSLTIMCLPLYKLYNGTHELMLYTFMAACETLVKLYVVNSHGYNM